MWRRVAILSVVWLSLSGLLSAAACATDMHAQASSQSAGGCDEHPAPVEAPVNIECCALDQMVGPTAAGAVEPAKRLLLNDSLDQDLCLASAWPAPAHPSAYARGSPPTSTEPSDQSSLWLTTARLRL